MFYGFDRGQVIVCYLESMIVEYQYFLRRFNKTPKITHV